MQVTATELRRNIYQLLDEVLETGAPLEVARRGKLLRVVPVEPAPRLERLPKRPGAIRGDPDDLVHLDWSGEWHP